MASTSRPSWGRSKTGAPSGSAVPTVTMDRKSISQMGEVTTTPIDRELAATPDYTLPRSNSLSRIGKVEQSGSGPSQCRTDDLLASSHLGMITGIDAPHPASDSPSRMQNLLSTLKGKGKSLSTQEELGPASERSLSSADTTHTTAVSVSRNLVMPSAQRAGASFQGGLNVDSPPLTPTSEHSEEALQEAQYSSYQHSHSPRHQWSAAQASADANSVHSSVDTPPITASPSPMCNSPVLMLTNLAQQSGKRLSTAGLSVSSTSHAEPEGILPSHHASDRDNRCSNLLDDSTRSALRAEGIDFRIPMRSRIMAFLSRQSASRSTRASAPLMPPLRPHLPAIMSVLLAFTFSTIAVAMLLSTLPLKVPRSLTGLSFTEIRSLCISLRTYAMSSPRASLHALGVISALFTFLHAFNVPGSLLINIVYGATFGTMRGTLYTSIFTAVGGSACYTLCHRLAPIITSLPWLARPLGAMRRALGPARYTAKRQSSISKNGISSLPTRKSRSSSSSSGIWTYLLFLRLLPVVPYGVMNIACGVLSIPLFPFAATLAVGSMPWNFITCQVGEILQDIVEAVSTEGTGAGAGGRGAELFIDAGKAHLDDAKQSARLAATRTGNGLRLIAATVWRREMMIKLALLTLAVLLPLALGRWARSRKSSREEYEEEEEEVEDGLSGETEEEDAADEGDSLEMSNRRDAESHRTHSPRPSFSAPRGTSVRVVQTPITVPEEWERRRRGHSREATDLVDPLPLTATQQAQATM